MQPFLKLLPFFSCMMWATLLAEEPHWSFAPLHDHPAPAVSEPAWIRSDIDAFVIHELERQKLRPQPEADRNTLIRRVAVDLTGLPPTPEQIKNFLRDDSPNAYQRMVDLFLASPHYGERWGRHWLDVARFGETDGILTVNEDKPRGDRWRYRDATIKALNADLPFDRFVRYQFVDPPEAEAAFGGLKQFIHLGTRLQRNADPNDKQHHRIDDMVATTGNAFLGLTIGCARCHDHPVDPIGTREYYELSAVFFDQVNEAPKASKKAIPLQITEPRVLKKGSWSSPGAAVDPGYVKVLMQKPASHWQAEGEDKQAALADWLTDTQHGAGQQLARVIVNRLWHHHFGRGIVSTPNDFGVLGATPTHPELLDWLALRLIEHEWRLKPMHRLIMNSAVYRQAGARDPAQLERDAENEWLWHFRPRRMESEAVRDHLLSVAGVLDLNMFGPSLPVGAYKKPVADTPKHWRRSIYLLAHRTVPQPTLSLFDPPVTERSLGKRNTGSSPESALFALNAPLVWDLSEQFARRLAEEAGERPNDQVDHAYQLAFARSPLPEERRIALGLLHSGSDRALVEFCHVILGLNEFIYVH